MMNIVFFGSGNFAVKILENIDRRAFPVSLVVTQPDRKQGRHLHLGATPVKTFALNHGLNVFQPEDINNAESLERLKKENADVFLVVSYGRILSAGLLDVPRIMGINIHSSLLPKYRGAAPVNRALIHGEKTTGVTFIKMNAGMDCGDILLQKTLKIGRDDTAPLLDEKLAVLASKYINKLLAMIEQGRCRLKKQHEKAVSYAALMHKQDGLIRWQETPAQIYNRFRGCYGWPGTFTYFRGKILKILELKPGRPVRGARPGTIVKAADNALVIACKRGTVIITEVLPESHRKMPVSSFLAGHDVKIGNILGA
ncbi:MAG: methionyl-tRNA formyltransferase [Candidatus Velamenicoccus archaeovorus]